MATIGSMIVNVLANTAGFVNGMKTVRGELRNVKAEASATQSALAAFGGVKSMLAGLGVGISTVAIARQLGQTADEIDNLVKTSDRLGITTENLRGLEYGAALAGVSTEQLSSALGFMSKQLAEAAHGGGKAKAVIKELGLSAKTLASMTPDEALLRFTRSLAGVKDESEKVRIAMRLFGDAGVPLLTLLNEGEGAIKGYMEEAKKLGLTYSKEEADKVVAYNDAWEKLKTTLGSFTKDIVINVSPAAIKIVEDLQDMLSKTADVRTKEGGPKKAGSWLGMLYPQFIEDFITNDKITGYDAIKRRGNEVLRVLPDGTKVRRGYTMDPSLEAPGFTSEELEASRKKLDPRFRPGGPGEAAAGATLTSGGLDKVQKWATGRVSSAIDMVVEGWQDTGQALKQVDGMGADLGKKMRNQYLIWELRGRPSEMKELERERKKKAAEAEKKMLDEGRESMYERRFRATQPTPTAPAGSGSAADMVRQSQQQQAAQLRAAEKANDHLRGIKDALTNPNTTGL